MSWSQRLRRNCCWPTGLILVLAACDAPFASRKENASTPSPQELAAVAQWQTADLGALEPQVEAQVNGALNALRQALDDGQSDTALAEKLGEVAMLHHLYRRRDRALIAYGLAAKIEPGAPRWPYYEALLRQEQGEMATTADALRRCIATGTEALAPRIRLAESLLEQGETESAHQQFAKLIEKHPASLRARVGWAEAELALGRSDSALEALQELRDQQPDAKRIRFALGRALRSAGQLDQARELLASVGPLTAADRRLDLDDPWVTAMAQLNRSSEAAWNFGRGLLQRQRWNEAATALRTAIQRNPSRPAYWTDLGTALARLGQSEEAGRAFSKALEIDAEYLPAMAQLASHHRHEGAVEEALARYDQILALDPRRSAVLLLKADLLHSTGRAAAAIEPLERSLALKPDDERALLALTMCYFELGDTTAAEATVARGLRARPNSFWFRSLDLRLCALGRPPCRPDLEEAELLRRARPTAFAAETHAMALAAGGDLKAARAWQRTAIDSLRAAGAPIELALRRLDGYHGQSLDRTVLHRSELAAARATMAEALEAPEDP